MLSWQIGDVTVTRVVEMELPVPYHPKSAFLKEATPEALAEIPWLRPHFVTEDGALTLSIHALVVRAPGVNLVVDTCVGNDKPRVLLGGQALQTTFLDSLEAAGCPAGSVDTVVCTHLHVDHVGWNTMRVDGRWVPTFPNARYLIGRREYEHWRQEGDDDQQTILGDSVQPIFDAGLATLVEMNHRISDEIRLTPTPGHTPGHVSVLIESNGERAMITGDMLHHPC
jgi:glyoxylase-like metal-dependent hydrolase (beta-lactamase superfamily II)